MPLRRRRQKHAIPPIPARANGAGSSMEMFANALLWISGSTLIVLPSLVIRYIANPKRKRFFSTIYGLTVALFAVGWIIKNHT